MAPMLTVGQVAERLNLSPFTVRGLIKQGRLRPCRLTRKLLIEESEVERAVREASGDAPSSVAQPAEVLAG